jgi:hypothetical protein
MRECALLSSGKSTGRGIDVRGIEAPGTLRTMARAAVQPQPLDADNLVCATRILVGNLYATGNS